MYIVYINSLCKCILKFMIIHYPHSLEKQQHSNESKYKLNTNKGTNTIGFRTPDIVRMRLGRVCYFLKRDNSYLENKTLLFLFNFFFSSKAYLRSILKKKRFFYGSFSSYSYAYNVANTIQEATL